MKSSRLLDTVVVKYQDVVNAFLSTSDYDENQDILATASWKRLNEHNTNDNPDAESNRNQFLMIHRDEWNLIMKLDENWDSKDILTVRKHWRNRLVNYRPVWFSNEEVCDV